MFSWGVQNFKRVPFLSKLYQRGCASVANSAASTDSEIKVGNFHRVNQEDPRNHGPDEEGRFYKLNNALFERLFRSGGFRKEQRTMFNIMDDISIMVRRPFLEIKQYLEKTDFSRPVNRYVIYGKYGSGKSFTLNHLLHYGYDNQYLLLHCPAPFNWVGTPEEYSASDSRPDRFDTPMDAALALQLFKTQNQDLLSQLDLRTTGKYTWSLREETDVGEPLLNVILHGINRVKHASDCYAVLLKELKAMSAEGRFKLLVVVDLANVLFMGRSGLRKPDKSYAEIQNITIARALTKMFHNDWNNGAVVVAVDSTDFHRTPLGYFTGTTSGPDLPKALLGDAGFQVMDPFMPIEVPKYQDFEAEFCMDYYTEREFVQRPESRTRAGREQIKFLSANNPFELYKLCCVL